MVDWPLESPGRRQAVSSKLVVGIVQGRVSVKAKEFDGGECGSSK